MKFSLTNTHEVKKFFIIFYIVGIVGMGIPALLPYFIILIPYALVLNFMYVAYFHPHKTHVPSLLVFSVIFILGIAIEVVGVKTGLVFGEYAYGSSLGPKVFSVPILIGINWLFLVYATASLFEAWRVSQTAKIILASLCMVGYDVVLEHAAPTMNMWSFSNNIVPIQNYVVWFCMALFFHFLIKRFRIQTKNPIVATVFFCQLLFFVAIVCMYKYIW